MVQIRGGEVIARMLQKEGVDKVFGIIDGTYFGFYSALHRLGIEIVTVPDSAIVDAMWTIIERCKVVAEPAAAAGLAALISGAAAVDPGSSVVCIVTGGNVDREKLRSLA